MYHKVYCQYDLHTSMTVVERLVVRTCVQQLWHKYTYDGILKIHIKTIIKLLVMIAIQKHVSDW